MATGCRMLTVAGVLAEFPQLRNISAVYREARAGRLVSHRIAGRLMFEREDVEAYLCGCRRGGASDKGRKFVSKVILAGA